MDVDLAGPLTQFVATLKGGGVRSATIDPAELNLPGVLVAVTGVEFERLSGYTVNLELFLIVADNGVTRSMVALQALLSDVLNVVQPVDGEVRATGVRLPNTAGKPLPALAFNHDIYV